MPSSPRILVSTSTTFWELTASTMLVSTVAGQSSPISRVEFPWSGHATLSHVVGTPALIGTGALGEVDRHATWVAQAMVGRGNANQDRGIAFGATLWGGATALDWNGTRWSRDWDSTLESTLSPYRTAFITGINGQTADVINSSWGFLNPAGNFGGTVGYDAYAYTSGKLGVFSAGNEGPSASTVGGFGAGYNSITSAALGSDSGLTPFNTASNFSSRGPSFYWAPVTSTTGQFSPTQRASIDLAAPGQNLRLAYYGGQTGGNRPEMGGSPGGAAGTSTTFSSNVQGTSFSAPITAAGAALLIGAGKTVFDDNPAAIDGRVIKAVLMNSADKTAGWNNGQSVVDESQTAGRKAATILPPEGPILALSALTGGGGAGSAGYAADGIKSTAAPIMNTGFATNTSGNSGTVISTVQSLDWSVGTGRMNLDTAYDQYFAGTTDVAGLGGGSIQQIGWDFGQVAAHGAFNDYVFDTLLLGGSTITVTVDWFVNRGIGDSLTAIEELKFADLDLEVWSVMDGVAEDLVATSHSAVNNVEHLNFVLPETDSYLIRVLYAADNYNFLDESAAEVFGLAWNATAVPELSSVLLLSMAFPVLIWRIRWRPRQLHLGIGKGPQYPPFLNRRDAIETRV